MNIGAQSGLVDRIHEEAMGKAVWLYLWFVWRQTRRSGLVLGGMPFTFEIISERSGFEVRKIRRWTEVLRKAGYIEITHLNFKHMRIRVLKSKKFNFKQMGLLLDQEKKEAVEKTKNGHFTLPKTGNGSTKNGQFKQSVSLSSNETPEEEERITAAAFTAIGYDLGPFGQKQFQEVWVRQFQNRNGHPLTFYMEAAIQECQQRRIGVPPQFFEAKHGFERQEKFLLENRDALVGTYREPSPEAAARMQREYEETVKKWNEKYPNELVKL